MDGTLGWVRAFHHPVFAQGASGTPCGDGFSVSGGMTMVVGVISMNQNRNGLRNLESIIASGGKHGKGTHSSGNRGETGHVSVQRVRQ